MSSADAFSYFWLGGVGLMGLMCLAKAIHELRSGVARWHWMGEKVERADDPFHYWWTVVGDFFGVAAAGFMFWFGLDMLHW